MPADRRLFDSSSMTPSPAPENDAVTCTVDEGCMPEPQSYPEIKALVDSAFGVCDELREREKRSAFDHAVRHLENSGEVLCRAAGKTTRFYLSGDGKLRSQEVS